MRLNQSPLTTLRLEQRLTPYLIQISAVYKKTFSDLLAESKQLAMENVFIEFKKNPSSHSQLVVSSQQDDPLTNIESVESLDSFLKQQMSLLGFSELHKDVMNLFIDGLDERGCVTDFPTIQKVAMKQFSLSKRQVALLLEKFQTLEPPGIGARNIKESLTLQVKALDLDEPSIKELLLNLVQNHLENIEKKDFSAISKALELTQEAVEALLAYMKDHLVANPISGYQHNAVKSQWVEPSFEVFLDHNQLKINFLEDQIDASFNDKYYKRLLGEAKDKASQDFIQQQVKKAKSYVDSIRLRKENLKACGAQVIHFQKGFFLKGERFLKPLTMTQVASDLSVSISTVSRLVNQKFIRFNDHVFALKCLFAKSHLGRTQHQLEEHLSSFFELFPHYSDQKIVDLAFNQGLIIARRTVTKYRHKLKGKR